MKLTVKRIAGFTFEGSYAQYQDIRWDEEVETFGVRVYPTNAKSYVIGYRSRGRKRIFTIGKVGIITLDEARKKARMALAHRNETDPADERRAFLKSPTFGDLAKSYLENHASKNRSYNDDKRRIEKRLLPKWNLRKLDAIKHQDILELHRSIGAEILVRKTGSKGKHYEANRILSLVRSMFNRAIAWGMLKADHRNPAIGITPFEEQERERWIQETEMRAIAEAIRACRNIYVRGALWLAFLTGMRIEEVLSTEWAQFDPGTQTLTLPTTKNRRPHVVAITNEARSVIEAMPRTEGNPFVFCGRVKGKHLTTVRSSWEKIVTAATVPDVRIHDIRRTVGSWLAQQGESIPTIKALLNHSDIRTTLRYTRSAKPQERKALETSSRKLRPMIGNLSPHSQTNGAESTKRKIRLRRPSAIPENTTK